MYRKIVTVTTDNAEFTLDRLTDVIGNVIFKSAPLLAPAPSALAIFNALAPRWGGALALVAALAVEGLGYAAAENALKVWHLNRALERIQVRQWIPNSLFVLYFIASLATIFSFETMPAIAAYMAGSLSSADLAAHSAPLVYPFLTVVGAGLYGVKALIGEGEKEISLRASKVEAADDFKRRQQVEAWEMEQEQKAAEFALKLEAKRLKLEADLSSRRVQNASNIVQNGHGIDMESNGQAQATRGKLTREAAKLEMLDIYRTSPNAPLRDVGQAIGRSPQTVSNWLAELEQAGQIHRNGNGIEILGGHNEN